MAHVKSSTAHPFQCEGGGQPEEKAVGEQDRHAEAQQLVLEAERRLARRSVGQRRAITRSS